MGLDELPHGQRGIVARINGEPGLAVSLLRLGFVPGAPVCVIRSAPLGDPLQVEVSGSHLAIRRDVAATIQVEPASGTGAT
ncbi:MAG: ferrous iron transport protein A [Planctomycetota bacterium]